MSKIEWPSNLDKVEAIGYLARPGVINAIEAMVPKNGGVEKFKKEFSEGYMYTKGVPYPMDKWTVQYRIYLQDTDGCPEFLESQLDSKYKNRINDTDFIRDLVKHWGFKFTRGDQDYRQIRERSYNILRLDPELEKAFNKGYYAYDEFVIRLRGAAFDVISSIPVVHVAEPQLETTKERSKNNINSDNIPVYSKRQMLNIGWIGEKYIFELLSGENEDLINSLDLDGNIKKVIWFNKDFMSDSGWSDQSVGKGCDIVVITDNDSEYFIEVKTSRKMTNIFTMTNNELVKMQDNKTNYVVIKVDWIEHIIDKKEVLVRVFNEPFDKLFKAEMIKDVTFKVK